LLANRFLSQVFSLRWSEIQTYSATLIFFGLNMTDYCSVFHEMVVDDDGVLGWMLMMT